MAAILEFDENLKQAFRIFEAGGVRDRRIWAGSPGGCAGCALQEVGARLLSVERWNIAADPDFFDLSLTSSGEFCGLPPGKKPRKQGGRNFA